MTVLSRSTLNSKMASVQCDFCCPPAIATNELTVLSNVGWRISDHGASHDVCPACVREGVQRRSGLRRELFGDSFEGGRLPGLMVIGAAKCGTTSLHAYLNTHPDVFMAELKELRFFQDPDCADWLPWYEQQFISDAAVVGESSTMYTRSPALPGVAERMAAAIPDAKLVYLVRDPVDRAIASYLEERFQLFDPRPVEEAFADVDDPYNPYLSASRYAEQVGVFLEHYQRDQLLIVPLSDLEKEPQSTMAKVFEFVGVDPGHEVDSGYRHNVGSTKYEYVGVGARLRQGAPGRLVARLPDRQRERVRAAARRLLSRPLPRPDLTPELRARLKTALAPDAQRFRDLTGLTFADWSV